MDATTSTTVQEHEAAHAHELPFWRRYIFSTDHKVIGIQALITALIMAFIGAGMSAYIRLELGWPDPTLDPSSYYALVTLHGTIMLFFVLTPALTAGFGNFLIPLQIGARDMAFPVLNMISYWMIPPAIIVMLASFFVPGGPAQSGWTAYPPLSILAEASPGSGLGQTLWLISIFLLLVGFTMGTINYLTTILNMRAKGMSMTRMPLTIWGLFTTAIISLLAFAVLISAALLMLVERLGGASFFVPAGLVVGGQAIDSAGGDPLLWQHLFWFFGHPEVYILILPAFGFVSDMISTHARKPIFGYKFMVGSMLTITVLSFLVWGHHMFTSGMNPLLGTGFMIASLIIAVPSAIKTFNWLATLWGAKIRFRPALLFSIGFVSLFVTGGLSGIMIGSAAVDSYFHDSYFIIAHFHMVMGAASLFGVFGAIYHWFPKMFGRMLNERLGRLHFWITFIGIYAIFFPMHYMGIAGMPRRYQSFDAFEFLSGMGGLNAFVSIATFITFGAQLIFLYNVVASAIAGRKASRNPWRATTLEWAAPSPPPHGNWGAELPTVYRWAYDYSVPGADEDFIGQTDPGTAPEGEPRTGEYGESKRGAGDDEQRDGGDVAGQAPAPA